MAPTLDLAQIKSFTDDFLLSCNLIWGRIFTKYPAQPGEKDNESQVGSHLAISFMLLLTILATKNIFA